MWMRVDDGLHAHRKTRMATKGSDKRRDVAPMGLWVLAGSWSGRNNQAGWVPCDELDRFDDDWEALAGRLVAAGFWWPENRDGEPGYGFNDWDEWNNPTGPSASGTFGNHQRWHVNKGVVKEGCEHCPQEPKDLADEPPDESDHRPDSGAISPRSSPRVAPDIGSDIAPDSHPISLRDHRPESLTRPDPTRTQPQKSSSARADIDTDFVAWYAEYPRKEAKGAAVKAYRTARKKADAPTLVAAVVAQRSKLTAKGREFTPLPASWLNAERWLDEPDHRDATVHRLPHASELRRPPSGLTDREMDQWIAENQR